MNIQLASTTRRGAPQSSPDPPTTGVSFAPSAATASPRKVSLSAFMAAAAVGPLVWSQLYAKSTTQHIAALSLTIAFFSAAAAALMLALPDLRSGFSHWRVGPWYVAIFGACFGIASLSWLSPRTDSSSSQIQLDAVHSALELCLFSLIIWTIGYFIGPPRFVIDAAQKCLSLAYTGTSSELKGSTGIWVLYGLGVFAKVLKAVLTGIFGYVGDPSRAVSEAPPYAEFLNIVAGLSTVAVAMAAYSYFSRRGVSPFTVALLVASEFVVGSLSGTKEAFATTILAVLIAYGATRGRIPKAGMLVGVLLFLLVVIPYNASYRGAVRGEYNLAPSQGVAVAPSVLAESVRGGSLGDTLSASSTYLLQRLRDVDGVAIIVQRTPSQIPFRPTKDLLAAPLVGLVPRVVWPNKPILTTGYQFSLEYFGLRGIFTSSAITPQGDLYRYGGYWVVAIGMLLFGVGCRLLDRCLQPERDPRAIFFLVLIFPLVIRSELDYFSMLASIPAVFVAGVLAVRLGTLRSSAQPS